MSNGKKVELLLFHCLLYFGLIHFTVFAGENYTIKGEIFLPQKFFVGDTVELRIEMKLSDGVEVEVPRSIPHTDWLKIVDMKVEKLRNNDALIRIFFISYQPGTQVLPTLRFGEVTLDNVQIYTSSVLKIQEAKYLRGIKSQLAFPKTYRILIVLTFIVISLPFVLLIGFVKIKALSLRIREKILKRIPLHQYRHGLAELERDISRFEERIFYMKLTSLLKRYLSFRIGKNIESLTTKELAVEMGKSGLNDATVKKLMDFFRFSDSVKFQGYRPVRDDMRNHLEEMKKLPADIEAVDA